MLEGERLNAHAFPYNSASHGRSSNPPGGRANSFVLFGLRIVLTRNPNRANVFSARKNASEIGLDYLQQEERMARFRMRSRKGRYYPVTYSRIQGRMDCAEWISNEEAARWLTLNEIDLPQELTPLAETVTE